MAYDITEAGFEELWAEWETLLTQRGHQAVFFTPTWHRVWWQEMATEGDKLNLIAIRDGQTPVGIAPLMRSGGALSFLGDTDLCDFHDFIIAPGREPEFFSALLEHLDSQPWERLDLLSIAEHSPTLAHLPPLAREHGYVVEVNREDVAPGLALPESWDSYLMSLSRKDRHELRRKFRRLDSQASYKSYSLNGTSSLGSALDDFFELMRRSRQDKAIFLSQERERFFRRMTEEVARIGVLKLFFLELSGERVAAALCFDMGNALLLYNSGYDPAYSKLSVGLLLKALCLKEAIEDGKEYLDFLRGEEPYKYDLGAKDVQLYQVILRRA